MIERDYGKNENLGSGCSIEVWWTPDCGALHVERNPVTIPLTCPDGVKSGWDTEPSVTAGTP